MDPRSKKIGDLFANVGDAAKARALIEELYDPSVVFQDPIQRLEGHEGLFQSTQSLSSKTRNIRVRILSDAAGKDTLAIRWEMDFQLPLLPSKATMRGVSWMEFGPGGKCVRHTDYWDMGDILDQLVPLARPLHDLVRKMMK